jgi:MoaA/NifB/PqqE/SkfB family radical SAM enzyme
VTTYITPDKVYAHIDRLAAWRDGQQPAPVTLEWDCTSRCSRGCAQCHFAYTHTRGPLAHRRAVEVGDEADTAMVLRALGEAAAAGVLGVVWTGGGEPTLHPAFDQFVERAADVGLAQGIYTHGGHISERRAAIMAPRLSWAVVSLDAADKTSYEAYKGRGFDASCDGVRRLVAAGLPVVGVSFLLSSENYRDAPAMLALGRKLEATYTTFRPMIQYDLSDPAIASEDTSWVTAALPVLEAMAAEPGVVCDVSRFVAYRDWRRERSYHACYGIRLNATITPDGRVWVCPNRRGLPESSIGSLRTESFETVWARHPGRWTDFAACRVMCRLHQVNERLAAIETPLQHPEFV